MTPSSPASPCWSRWSAGRSGDGSAAGPLVGFGEGRLRIGVGAVRFPAAEQFLRQQAAGSPLAGPVGTLDADARESLVRDLQQTLEDWTDDDGGVVFPIQAWLATVHR
jgi:hypothetical protein